MAPAASGRALHSSRSARAVRAAKRGPGQRSQQPPGAAVGALPLLAMEEVLAAIQSLYMDELRPFGRILRKRLAEQSLAARCTAPDIDMDCLRATCVACPWLRVEDLEGGDWAALFTCYPEAFVDIYSPEDVYPAELWQAAAAYFEGLDDQHMVLPGGRYSCAQELMARGLDFLEGYSLGRVSHVVQLAISQKKLLGYLNGAVVPYGRSGSKAKDECAVRQQPFAGAPHAPSEQPLLAEWEQLRECMRSLMLHVPVDGSMPLSNVKRLFRSRFQTELSETALGHSKLSELLNDPRLQDTCFVKLQGHGYVVAHPQQPKPHGLPISLSSSIRPGSPPASPVLEEEGSLHITFAAAPASPVLEEEGSLHVTSAAAPAPPAPEEQGSLRVSFAEPAPGAGEEAGSLQVTLVDPERPSSESSPHRRYRIRNTFVEVEDEPLGQASPWAGGLRAAPLRWNTAPGCFGFDLDSDSDGDCDDEDDRGSSGRLSAVAGSAEGGPHGCAADSCSTQTGAGDEEFPWAPLGGCARGSESDLALAK
ncbi:unnamed protein product, partial [Prorocentrum cordatum]